MVVVPVHDQNALRFIPFQHVTVGLIALNALVFLYQMSLSETAFGAFAFVAGIIPASILTDGFDAAARLPLPTGWAYIQPEVTLVTYMFLHGDVWHLLGNMLFLWVFGDNIEDAMGHVRFLVFYLLCGVAAALVHAAVDPASEIPLIGASGAIAGLIGAYLMLYPRVRMWVLILMRIPLRLPAYLVLFAWLAMQLFFVAAGDQSGTAWWAHIGGFAAGVLLVPFFKRRSVALFGGGGDAAAA